MDKKLKHSEIIKIDKKKKLSERANRRANGKIKLKDSKSNQVEKDIEKLKMDKLNSDQNDAFLSELSFQIICFSVLIYFFG